MVHRQELESSWQLKCGSTVVAKWCFFELEKFAAQGQLQAMPTCQKL